VSLKEVSHSSLTAAQQEAVKQGDIVFNITVSSGAPTITGFDGTITVSVPYGGALPAAVWYLNNAGEMEKMDCVYDPVTKTVTFQTNHLSLYVVGADDTKPPEWKNPFSDVNPSDWFYGDVEYVVTNGLFYGTSETIFAPNASITRAMFVTVLYRIAGGESMSVIFPSPFDDVADGQWYSAAVAWTAANGIVSGIGGGLFAPDSEITRQDMAVMLLRYLKYIKADYVVTDEYKIFADETDIASYAKDAVQTLNKLGIIQGKGNNIIDPKGNATRAEAAAMLRRFAARFK